MEAQLQKKLMDIFMSGEWRGGDEPRGKVLAKGKRRLPHEGTISILENNDLSVVKERNEKHQDGGRVA